MHYYFLVFPLSTVGLDPSNLLVLASTSVLMLGRRALALTAPYAAVVASLSRRRSVMRRLLPHGLDVTTYDG